MEIIERLATPIGNSEGYYRLTISIPSFPRGKMLYLRESRSEALESAQEAIAGHLEALRDVGERVPQGPGQATVETVTIAVSQ